MDQLSEIERDIRRLRKVSRRIGDGSIARSKEEKQLKRYNQRTRPI